MNSDFLFFSSSSFFFFFFLLEKNTTFSQFEREAVLTLTGSVNVGSFSRNCTMQYANCGRGGGWGGGRKGETQVRTLGAVCQSSNRKSSSARRVFSLQNLPRNSSLSRSRCLDTTRESISRGQNHRPLSKCHLDSPLHSPKFSNSAFFPPPFISGRSLHKNKRSSFHKTLIRSFQNQKKY